MEKVGVSGSFPKLRDGAQNLGRKTWLDTDRLSVSEVRATQKGQICRVLFRSQLVQKSVLGRGDQRQRKQATQTM